MLEKTVEIAATNITHSEELFYQSAEFWVGAAFVFVVILLFSPVVKSIKSLLDNRIQYIKDQLQEAENLKIDAQKLYAEYERKFQNIDKEVDEIITNQQEVIMQTKERKIHDLENILKQKEIDTKAKINYAFTQATAEINEKIVERAVNIISSIISSKLTKKDQDKLINNSINKLKNISFD